eukprot:TRINITY_DN15982_c0_g1_i1.p1 TRINITY_DN15982_c0_g1~~TRINITY_DN15982_c0_g1_i1.p1  ORF type:complete len:489 (-),score=56.98 TRINITY_DN15982_c0_g1_i1:246-1517(-)
MVNAMRQQYASSMSPSIALALIPDPSHSYALQGAYPAQAVGPPLLRDAHIPPSLPPPSYSAVWASLGQDNQLQAPQLIASVPLSYESILRQTIGSAALDPAYQVPVQEFEQTLLGPRSQYSSQVPQVRLPHGTPDYGQQIRNVEPIPPPAFGRRAQAAAQQEAEEALQHNRQLIQVFQRNAIRMQRAIPRPPGEEAPSPAPAQPSSEPTSPDQPVQPQAHQFHKVKLEIQVIKATDLPDADLLSSCDPYVEVSVVDGNPLKDAAAIVNYEQWRQSHEQWHGQTRVIDSSVNPQWRARFHTSQIRNRDTTHVHFRVMDSDAVAFADRQIGQTAVPLAEVLDDNWGYDRGIALRPMNRSDQQAWVALKAARLHVSVTWEGVLGQVKEQTKQKAADAASSAGAFAQGTGRAQRSPRRNRDGGGLFG